MLLTSVKNLSSVIGGSGLQAAPALFPDISCEFAARQAGAVGNATLQNFPDMHFSRWGSSTQPPPARRNSLMANSEISVASDDDDAAPPAAVRSAAAAAVTQSPATGGGGEQRQRRSNDAIIDIALQESAA